MSEDELALQPELVRLVTQEGLSFTEAGAEVGLPLGRVKSVLRQWEMTSHKDILSVARAYAAKKIVDMVKNGRDIRKPDIPLCLRDNMVTLAIEVYQQGVLLRFGRDKWTEQPNFERTRVAYKGTLRPDDYRRLVEVLEFRKAHSEAREREKQEKDEQHLRDYRTCGRRQPHGRRKRWSVI